MKDLGKFLKNGVALPLGNDRRNIKLHRHASGGIAFELGSETVLMSPRQAYELAMALMQGAGVVVQEQVDPAARIQQLRS